MQARASGFLKRGAGPGARLAGVSRALPAAPRALLAQRSVLLGAAHHHKRGFARFQLPDMASPKQQKEPAYSPSLSGGHRVFILNRASTGHKIDPATVEWLSQRLRVADASREAFSSSVRSTGKDVFSEGFDFTGLNTQQKLALLRAAYQMFWVIARAKKPMAVVLDGVVKNGAIGFATGRYRMATENTVLNFDSWVPMGGSSFYLSRLDFHVGFYLALTGSSLSGEDAVQLRFLTHYILSNNVKDMEAMLSENSGHWSTADETISYMDGMDHTSYVDPPLSGVEGVIKRCFSLPTVEAIFQALEAETVHTAFAEATLKKMRKRSPTSLKLTHKLLTEASVRPLDECLKLEYRALARAITKESDFHLTGEPVPPFKPSTVADVLPDLLEEYTIPAHTLVEANSLKNRLLQMTHATTEAMSRAYEQGAYAPPQRGGFGVVPGGQVRFEEGVGTAGNAYVFTEGPEARYGNPVPQKVQRGEITPHGELLLPGVDFDYDFENHSLASHTDRDRLGMAVEDDRNDYPHIGRQLGVDGRMDR